LAEIVSEENNSDVKQRNGIRDMWKTLTEDRLREEPWLNPLSSRIHTKLAFNQVGISVSTQYSILIGKKLYAVYVTSSLFCVSNAIKYINKNMFLCRLPKLIDDVCGHSKAL